MMGIYAILQDYLYKHIRPTRTNEKHVTPTNPRTKTKHARGSVELHVLTRMVSGSLSRTFEIESEFEVNISKSKRQSQNIGTICKAYGRIRKPTLHFCHFLGQNSRSIQTSENSWVYCRFWGTLKVPFGCL